MHLLIHRISVQTLSRVKLVLEYGALQSCLMGLISGILQVQSSYLCVPLLRSSAKLLFCTFARNLSMMPFWYCV